MPLKLNLGSGDTVIDGYTPIDRKIGSEVYPLDGVEDESVEIIRASHVLEHFGHQDCKEVVSHWVRKLKPGGQLKLAVPDFQKVAEAYLAAKPMNVQGYVMGGQVDQDDFHKVIFDKESLTELLVNAGLERVCLWESELKDDCAALPISLNLMGFKPVGDVKTIATVAVLSRVGRAHLVIPTPSGSASRRWDLPPHRKKQTFSG